VSLLTWFTTNSYGVRHQRRRKAAKAKVKEYDQGKIKHDQLNSLAQIFHARKMRFLTKAS